MTPWYGTDFSGTAENKMREQIPDTAVVVDVADGAMAVEQPTLTPEVLISLLTITMPSGPVTVKGLASEQCVEWNIWSSKSSRVWRQSKITQFR